VIEPILGLDRVRVRSSWFGFGAEPSTDQALNRRRIAHMWCSKHYRPKPAMKRSDNENIQYKMSLLWYWGLQPTDRICTLAWGCQPAASVNQ